MEDETEQLRNAVRWKKKATFNRTAKLSDTLSKVMKRIGTRQRRFGGVYEFWSELLPDELREHCRLESIYDGQLEVMVDSPAYMYELRLCSSQLLGELQRNFGRGRIRKINFAVG